MRFLRLQRSEGKIFARSPHKESAFQRSFRFAKKGNCPAHYHDNCETGSSSSSGCFPIFFRLASDFNTSVNSGKYVFQFGFTCWWRCQKVPLRKMRRALRWQRVEAQTRAVRVQRAEIQVWSLRLLGLQQAERHQPLQSQTPRVGCSSNLTTLIYRQIWLERVIFDSKCYQSIYFFFSLFKLTFAFFCSKILIFNACNIWYGRIEKAQMIFLILRRFVKWFKLKMTSFVMDVIMLICNVSH